jgi:hypothetical protein
MMYCWRNTRSTDIRARSARSAGRSSTCTSATRRSMARSRRPVTCGRVALAHPNSNAYAHGRNT